MSPNTKVIHNTALTLTQGKARINIKQPQSCAGRQVPLTIVFTSTLSLPYYDSPLQTTHMSEWNGPTLLLFTLIALKRPYVCGMDSEAQIAVMVLPVHYIAIEDKFYRC